MFVFCLQNVLFTNEEINMILERFKNNHCVYYAFLTAYCTGLRVAEVFALTWNDIDFRNKTISVNKSYRTIPIGDTLLNALK